MKKLVHMEEEHTRVLRITDAPKSYKKLLVGRYVSVPLYVKPKPNRCADTWTTTKFIKALRYKETLKELEGMQAFMEELKTKHRISTEVVLVTNNVTAFSIGDADTPSFYFTGINKDGVPVFLTLMPPSEVQWLKDNGLKLTDKFKAGDRVMIWRKDSARTWFFDALPSDDLVASVNQCAKEHGVSNVIVNRLYR